MIGRPHLFTPNDRRPSRSAPRHELRIIIRASRRYYRGNDPASHSARGTLITAGTAPHTRLPRDRCRKLNQQFNLTLRSEAVSLSLRRGKPNRGKLSLERPIRDYSYKPLMSRKQFPALPRSGVSLPLEKIAGRVRYAIGSQSVLLRVSISSGNREGESCSVELTALV